MVNIVSSMTVHEIREIAIEHRSFFGLKENESYPTLPYIEYLNDRSDVEFLRILEDEEMAYAHGIFDVKSNIITFNNSCYKGAGKGDPECLFTVNHEFSHYILHSGSELYRLDPEFNIPEDMCPEVQADTLAIELAIDFSYLKKCLKRESLGIIADRHGIPRQKLWEHLLRLIKCGDIVGQQMELRF